MILLSVLLTIAAGQPQLAQSAAGTYNDSLVLAPLYVSYNLVTPEKFAADAAEIKQAIGSAPHVLLGFASYENLTFPDIPLTQPITVSDMQSVLDDTDLIVKRAHDNGLVTHISIISGFFHPGNNLRYSAIRQDMRNAQWFSDGWIADPNDLQDPDTVPPTVWLTPSRYANPVRVRIEEGTRIVAQHLAGLMAQFPNTFLTMSGDGETELTLERNFTSDGTQISKLNNIIYTDYSPFMVEEFRDSIRAGKYAGDLSPGTDDNGDGHTFNGDYGQSFTTWQLRYFDNSGPISFSDYVAMPQKLPTSGPYAIPGGFDAPRVEDLNSPFFKAWILFRQDAVRNWSRDFATWMTTSPDPMTGFTIPAARYYTHQIPADFIFGQSDNLRLRTSASPISTAIIDPVGSTGVTAFNGYDGRNFLKTATPSLFSSLFSSSDNWGIMEYNPCVPYSNSLAPSSDLNYYMNELRVLHNFQPHVLIPFAWSDYPQHKMYSLRNSTFERALHQFVQEIGKTPWFSWHARLG